MLDIVRDGWERDCIIKGDEIMAKDTRGMEKEGEDKAKMRKMKTSKKRKYVLYFKESWSIKETKRGRDSNEEAKGERNIQGRWLGSFYPSIVTSILPSIIKRRGGSL